MQAVYCSFSMTVWIRERPWIKGDATLIKGDATLIKGDATLYLKG